MFKVYLAGPIASLDAQTASSWREELSRELEIDDIICYSPLREKLQYLPKAGPIGHNPDNYTLHPLTTAEGITARDRNDVFTSDLMIANFLNYSGKPTGTAIEFGWADAMDVPIIMIIDNDDCPAAHPMLLSLAGFRTQSLEEAAEVARAILLP